MPIVAYIPAPVPKPIVLTDAMRLAVLAEQRAYCAPWAFLRFAESLRARHYPVDPFTTKE